MDLDTYSKRLRLRIAARLKVAIQRSELSVSQNQLGRLLGVTSGTVSSWLSGRTQPSLEQFTVICHGLLLSANQILGITSFKEYQETETEILDRGVITTTVALGRLERLKGRRRLNEIETRIGELVEALGQKFERAAAPSESAGPRHQRAVSGARKRSAVVARPSRRPR